MRTRMAAAIVLWLAVPLAAQVPEGEALPNTGRLELADPLDVAMVRSISAFAESEIALSRDRRAAHWNRDYTSAEAYERSIAPHRERLRTDIGAVDELIESARVAVSGIEDFPTVAHWRIEAFPGVSAEGVMTGNYPSVILVPDAAWSPEMLAGLLPGEGVPTGLAAELTRYGGAMIPRLISREDEYSGRPEIRFTNQPHREFVYRPAFELGRHIIGYEVQKIRALVSASIAQHQAEQPPADRPIVVWGIGEGGLLALYAAAIDPRIDVCVVSGYFGEREGVWREPIYRNVWRLLAEFGDADIAGLIAPRTLIIQACNVPEVDGPPAPRDGRNGAAPGVIKSVPLDSVEREFARAREHWNRLGAADNIRLVNSGEGTGSPDSPAALATILEAAGLPRVESHQNPFPLAPDEQAELRDYIAEREKRQIDELQRHTQRLMHTSDKARDRFWSHADRSSLEAWEKSQEFYRDHVYDELFGRIPYGLLPPNARSRKVIDEPTHVGYEVVLDVFRSQPDAADGSQAGPLATAAGEPVIAGGILLIPKNLQAGEKRPCVVCQHGLEGVPLNTIVTDPELQGYRSYKGFSTQLVRRGFIVYAPQNPYRGGDEFRVIQRKSNPLGRSLFSYIIPQHQQTLNWLAALPYVDADRIAFYGLSYGGKTAVRVPPLLPPRNARNPGPSATGAATSGDVGYCLSICSADFNEWILKNSSTEDRYSYVFTGEYEIFEWNMGHIANYAELSSLMTPRPFMVERGHDDGVAPDEWVAWEFAKVQRHYDKLGIGDRAEMEVFNGPHTINGQGTFEFLHKHLDWPRP